MKHAFIPHESTRCDARRCSLAPGTLAIAVALAGWLVAGSAAQAALITSTANAILGSTQHDALMGYSVAGAGDVNGDGYDDVIVGAPSYDLGEAYEGAAFVFLGGPGGVVSASSATAATTLQSNQASAAMGWSVASAGDLNADGYDDVIVGAPAYSTGGLEQAGAAFVFMGGPAGIANGSPDTDAATLLSDQAWANLGYSVARAGDVNADGYADVIVGAPVYSAGVAVGGAAFVFMGSPAGIADGGPGTSAAILQSNQVDAAMGSCVAAAGDVNADGYADVIVGAPSYNLGQAYEGAAFVFAGGPAGIATGSPAMAAATYQSNQAHAGLGSSVAGAGDVNDDGYDDIIVGAPRYDLGQTDEGAAFVFLSGLPNRSTNGDPEVANATIQGDQIGANLGSVAGAGDVNDDGYDDVIVGAFRYGAPANEGGAFVFLGWRGGIRSGGPAAADFKLEVHQQDALLGTAVAGAGDVNGDGFADVIVGAPYYDETHTEPGTALVYLGGFVKGDLSSDLHTDLVMHNPFNLAHMAWLMNGTQRLSQATITPGMGLFKRPAGVDDFDGDWKNDLVVWNPQTGATEFWLMNGTARIGLPVPLADAPALPWQLVATGDFDRDHHPDLVWRNTTTQKLQIWILDGLGWRATRVPTPDQAADANWRLVAALDWNGDHNTDLLWYNTTSGNVVLWFMDAQTHRIAGQFTNPPSAGASNWAVVAAGDYGRGPGGLAGTKDIVWRNSTSGNLVVWHMDRAGNRTAGVFTNPVGPSPNPTQWTVVGPR